jgi:hypothetical protein
MYPGVKPKKAHENGKKTIDKFSGDTTDGDCYEKKTHRHKTVDKNMNYRMSTPMKDFDEYDRKSEQTKNEKKKRHDICELDISYQI